MSDCLRPSGLQHARLPCPSLSPGVCSNSTTELMVMLSNQIILCHPLYLLPSIFPSIRVFSNESALHQVAKVLEFQLQYQSFKRTLRTDLHWDGLIGSPCSPSDSQESSPTPQFKSINSSVLSFLYSPTPTSVYDYWENHTFD